MFKFFAVCLFALLACVAAKPQFLAAPAVSYATPVVAPAASVAYASPYYTGYASPYYASYAGYPYAAAAPYAGYWLRR